MDSLAFFGTRYDSLHGLMTSDLLDGLTDKQLRQRPHPAVNTIAWLLWHVSRSEDVGVNRFVADRAEVLDDEHWLSRLGAGRRDIGTGMDDAEVDALSGQVDCDALRAYWASVGRRTKDVVGRLTPADLDVIVTTEESRRIWIGEGGVMAKASWVAADHSRGWFLCHLGLTHSFGHLYEARVVKGLWGIRSR